MAPPKRLPDLPCPECTLRLGTETWIRIGHRRNVCRTCNNFVGVVNRAVDKQMRAAHPEEYQERRLAVERNLYPQVLEDFIASR
jgi:hypothetical protein